MDETDPADFAARPNSDLAAYLKSSDAIAERKAALRKEQFERNTARLDKMYAGPSRSQQLFALSQAFLQPINTGGGGFAQVLAYLERDAKGSPVALTYPLPDRIPTDRGLVGTALSSGDRSVWLTVSKQDEDRDDLAPGQNMIRDPSWAGVIGQSTIKNGFHQRIATRDDVADYK
jgi:hypothetical protein